MSLRGRRSVATLVASALVVAALALACAANPATGRRQLNFYSQAEEIEIGRRLTDPGKLAVRAQRVRVVELAGAMTFEEFLRRHPSDEKRELLELINGIADPSRTIPAGTLLRRVEGRKVGTQKIDSESSG
ncbi:MAG TPA: hypothetical protein VI942_01440 [Thermoanaerobaculia bacterium]|nr:hypothetical protein [Thermoanaerobaculia bacterium]